MRQPYTVYMRKLLFVLPLLLVFVGIACQQPPPTAAYRQPTFVEGRYAYVPSPSGIKVVDVNTPSKPLIVGELPTAGQVVRTQLAGDYLYAIKIQGWDPATGAPVPAGVVIASLDDPLRPEAVTFLPSAYGPFEMLATETHLLVADWAETRLYDITTPAAPALLEILPHKYDGFSQTADGTIYGGWASCYFRSGGCTGGITVLDLAQDKSTTYEYELGVQDVIVIEPYVYALGPQFAFGRLEDIADLSVNLTDPNLVNGHIVGRTAETLFTVNGNQFNSYDISDPSLPQQQDSILAAPDGTYFLETSLLNDDYALLVSTYGFHVMNTADPHNMFGIGYVALD